MLRTSRVSWLLAAALLSPAAALGDKLADDVARQVAPLIEGRMAVGCAVGVLRGDERRFFGFGEIEKGGGHTPEKDTIYEIGSVTKALTGTLLAEMSLHGEIALDDPLAEYLPAGVECPTFDDKPITLTHLASHTSGLPRLPDNLRPSDPKNPYADYSAERLYDFLSRHKLRRAPGQMEYSNYGMGLLGHVLAERAGVSYEELIADRICGPLGMNDTQITLTEEQEKHLAPPYRGDLAVDNNWDLAALAGAGALRSTVDDMLKLCEAALAEADTDIHKALQLAFEKRHGKPGDVGVGLGWHIARDGVTRWHNGRTGGYSAAVFIAPPSRAVVVVLANTSTASVDTVAEKLIQTVIGMDVPPIALREEVDVPVETLKSYEGVYAIAPVFALTVTVEDGKLMVQATGQQKFQVFAESPTKFFYKVVDAQLTFDVDDDGNVNGLTLHQNGMDMKAARAGR